MDECLVVVMVVVGSHHAWAGVGDPAVNVVHHPDDEAVSGVSTGRAGQCCTCTSISAGMEPGPVKTERGGWKRGEEGVF